MKTDLYTDRLLQLTAQISCIGHLDAPQAQAKAVSKLCGSEISVEVNVDEQGCVTEFAQQLAACALGQTSASVVAREIIGTSADEFRAIAAEMRAMLKDKGTPPQGRWADLAVLEGVQDYPARHASTLLVFDAILTCFDQLGV